MIDELGKERYLPSGMVKLTNRFPSFLSVRSCPFCGSVSKRADLYGDVQEFAIKGSEERTTRVMAAVIVCGCGAQGAVIERPKTRDGLPDLNVSDDTFLRSAVHLGWNGRRC